MPRQIDLTRRCAGARSHSAGSRALDRARRAAPARRRCRSLCSARLPSILSDADRCFDPRRGAPPRGTLARSTCPSTAAGGAAITSSTRSETTLELLEATPGDDGDALYFYRLALFHECAAASCSPQMSRTLELRVGLLAAPAW